MAQSKHMQLRDAVAAAIASVAGGRVYRNRAFTLAKSASSQVHVNLRDADLEQPTMYAGHPRDWLTDVQVVVLARRDGSAEADDVVDALWVEIYGLVMADASLGGLADDLQPGPMRITEDQADTSVARLEWLVTARHRTGNNSISS